MCDPLPTDLVNVENELSEVVATQQFVCPLGVFFSEQSVSSLFLLHVR